MPGAEHILPKEKNPCELRELQITTRQSFSIVVQILVTTFLHGCAEGDDTPDYLYVPIKCTICLMPHLVSPKTGHVLGLDDVA